MIELESYDSFIERLASSSPAPGGGAASAMVSIVASSLNQMVASLTQGKKKYAEHEAEMAGIVEKSRNVESDLRSLMKEDEDAFNKIIEAMRMPKESDEEKEARRNAMQKAMRGAAKTPWKIAASAREVLELSKKLAEHGNKNAITDAACSALFAHAAIHGALYNVRINLLSIRDEEFVKEERTKLSLFLEDCDRIKSQVIRLVDTEIGK